MDQSISSTLISTLSEILLLSIKIHKLLPNFKMQTVNFPVLTGLYLLIIRQIFSMLLMHLIIYLLLILVTILQSPSVASLMLSILSPIIYFVSKINHAFFQLKIIALLIVTVTSYMSICNKKVGKAVNKI